jgi:hypothetical protein
MGLGIMKLDVEWEKEEIWNKLERVL